MIPQIKSRAPFLCALLALALPVNASESGSAESPFRSYTVLDGLAQSEVNGIDQDSAGYLWFTTSRGLNRFDGKEFKTLTVKNGLRHNGGTAIHVGISGRIWVGDVKGGLTLLNGIRVAATIEPMPEADNDVLDIVEFGGRVLAIIDDYGVVEVVEGESGYSLRHVADDESRGLERFKVAENRLWVQAEAGLHFLDMDAAEPLVLLDKSLRKVHAIADGVFWASTDNGVIGRWSDGDFSELMRLPDLSPVEAIALDHAGQLRVATSDALVSFDTNEGTLAEIASGMKRYSRIDGVTDIFIDAENSLWLASSFRLIRFLGDRFRHYRLQLGTDLQTVWSVTESDSGQFWFGTSTGLIRQNADETLTLHSGENGLPEGEVRDVVTDANGAIWVAITHKGLYRIAANDSKAFHIAETDGLQPLDLTIAPDGAVWMATLGSGVWRYDVNDASVQRFSTPDNTSVYTLDVGADGSVWYGADYAGVVRLSPGLSGIYLESQLQFGDKFQERLFNHVRVAGDGVIWIATDEGGLFRYANGQFTQIDTVGSLEDANVYIVEPLDNGTVVIGSELGLYQFTPGADGFTHYNAQGGFVGLETNVHATYIDSGGHLWVGTVDGATRMDVDQPQPEQSELNPTITRIETVVDSRAIRDGGEVAPNEYGVNIEFAAISLLNPTGTEYSYKFAGAPNWGEPTTNRSVSFPRIQPGSYAFLVRTRSAGGEWGSHIASHRFVIRPFFWQRTSFILCAVIVTLILLRIFMVYRTRKIRWMNDTLRAQVLERTASIDSARKKLQQSNDRLSEEVNARAELETRFKRAFENAPIGMGLLDSNGCFVDANPALRKMFWLKASEICETLFADRIQDTDKERFADLYEKLIHSDCDALDERLTCLGYDGEPLEVVVNLSTVNAEDGRFLYSVVQVQDITESLRLTQKLEYQASYDELTGLLNRRAFETELNKACGGTRRDDTKSYLMFMDLDQFKVVNDTSGHNAGDELLKEVSAILEDCVRGNDVVGRLGGDEFAVILWACPTDVAKRIAESIRSRIEDFRFHWGAETYRIGVSIGGLQINPAMGNASEIQQLADAACYSAKEEGRNRVHMIDDDHNSAREHRGQVRWIQRIREAMEMNRFAIYAQSIVPTSEDDDEPEQLEILLRLRDPVTKRLVPPGAFLPAVERYGLSVELDQWVVRSLMDTLFIHEAFQASRRQYWINLSGSSVGDKRFAAFLKDAIKNSPLPRGTINFEVTETAAMRSVTNAGELMADLKEMGCRFSLDDFGSGLSSFGYLKKLPVDFIKIDGMFIRDLVDDTTDRIFVKSIIEIAASMNIKTIAEFVENPELLEIVTDLGAHYAQGFGVGRPYVLAPQFMSPANSRDAEPHAKAG